MMQQANDVTFATYCDECGNEWQFSAVDIIKGKIINAAGYELLAIVCPKCLAITPIMITDKRAQALMNGVKAQSELIQRARRRGMFDRMPKLKRVYDVKLKRLRRYIDLISAQFASGTFHLLSEYSKDVIYTADNAETEKDK